jgi:hypothetical protein
VPLAYGGAPTPICEIGGSVGGTDDREPLTGPRGGAGYVLNVAVPGMALGGG